MTSQAFVRPSPIVTRSGIRLWLLLAIGGVCGLAWAAALRGFRAQIVGVESVGRVLGRNFRLDRASWRSDRHAARLGGAPAPHGRPPRLAIAGAFLWYSPACWCPDYSIQRTAHQ
jgi:hypothetical protein